MAVGVKLTLTQMTSSPPSLDTLIAFVRAQHPAGSPLDNLSDAVTVSAQLSDQADSLIGHFVDQARRSGASWRQIGASMGVSKRAAQQRFVPRGPVEMETGFGDFSRFTQRARDVLAATEDWPAPRTWPGLVVPTWPPP